MDIGTTSNKLTSLTNSRRFLPEEALDNMEAGVNRWIG